MESAVGDPVRALLETITALDRAGLAKRWQEVFGCPAPRNAQAALLRGALAWQAQLTARSSDSQAKGRVRRLRRNLLSPQRPSLPVGSRLLREWRGHTYHVSVVADGFEYDGRIYSSLTAVARQITGMAWSGPVFFGVRR